MSRSVKWRTDGRMTALGALYRHRHGKNIAISGRGKSLRQYKYRRNAGPNPTHLSSPQQGGVFSSEPVQMPRLSLLITLLLYLILCVCVCLCASECLRSGVHTHWRLSCAAGDLLAYRSSSSHRMSAAKVQDAILRFLFSIFNVAALGSKKSHLISGLKKTFWLFIFLHIKLR